MPGAAARAARGPFVPWRAKERRGAELDAKKAVAAPAQASSNIGDLTAMAGVYAPHLTHTRWLSESQFCIYPLRSHIL